MDGEKELTTYNQNKLDRAMKREHLLNFLDKASEIEHMDETTERIRERERYVRAIKTASNFDAVNNQPTITRERVLRRGGKITNERGI
eukprot:scaffold22153_cov42-Attheya_sp.AAC.1